MSLRDAMRKAAGLLVELPPDEEEATVPGPGMGHSALDDLPDLELPPEARLPGHSTSPARPGAKTVEQIVRDSHGPNLDEIHVDEKQVGPASALVKDGKLDYTAVYRAANVPAATFTAEQMLETLGSLPAELPIDTRRATVKAMLGTLGKTMGATAETLVADASRKLAALHSYTTFLERKTGDLITNTGKEITELEAQIAAKRLAIDKAKSELAKVSGDCIAESKRLDEVLEFFSLDAGPSKYAPGPTSPAGQPVRRAVAGTGQDNR